MSIIKSSYPAASSAVSITLASLASDSSLLTGRNSAFIDNSGNQDLDHLLSGIIAANGSGTIEVWAYAAYKSTGGAPTFPDSIGTTDAGKAMTSQGIKVTALRPVALLTADGTSGRTYAFAPVSIANLFGAMPKYWGLFVTQATGAALSSADIQFERIQAQSV